MSRYNDFTLQILITVYPLISTYLNKCGLIHNHNHRSVHLLSNLYAFTSYGSFFTFCRSYSSIWISWLHAIDLVIALCGE